MNQAERIVFLVVEEATGSPAEGIAFTLHADGGALIGRLRSGRHGIVVLDDPYLVDLLYLAVVENHDDRYDVGVIEWTDSNGTVRTNDHWPRKRD